MRDGVQCLVQGTYVVVGYLSGTYIGVGYCGHYRLHALCKC